MESAIIPLCWPVCQDEWSAVWHSLYPHGKPSTDINVPIGLRVPTGFLSHDSGVGAVEDSTRRRQGGYFSRPFTCQLYVFNYNTENFSWLMNRLLIHRIRPPPGPFEDTRCPNRQAVCHAIKIFDVHISVYRSIIVNDDQQDATI